MRQPAGAAGYRRLVMRAGGIVLLVTSSLALMLVGCSAPGSAPAVVRPARGGATTPSTPIGTPTTGPVAAPGAVAFAARLPPTRASAPAPAPAAGPKGSRSTHPVGLRYVFPVQSAAAKFGRFHHDYPATDIFTPCGTAVLAPIGGRVAEVSRSDAWSSTKNRGASRGGLSVSLIGQDGVRYYASHLRSIGKPVRPGSELQAGAVIGRAGNTGDARGMACHVHFGISPVCGLGDWWNRRGTVSPYRFLKSWQSHAELSPAATVIAWRARHGCPKTPRSDP